MIRDHYWHKSKFMAGLTFFKNIDNEKWSLIQSEFTNLFENIEKKYTADNCKYTYGIDENILNEKIYPLIKKHVLN